MKKYLALSTTLLLLGLSSLTVCAAPGWVQVEDEWGNESWKFERNDGSYANTEVVEWDGNRYCIYDGYKLFGGVVAMEDPIDGVLTLFHMDASGVVIAEIKASDIDKVDERTAYIINPDTDSFAFLNDCVTVDPINEMKIVSALVGKNDVTSDMLNEKEKAVYEVVYRFINKEIEEEDSDYEKVVKITQFIWKKGSYEAGSHSNNPYGLLVLGRGVCTSYASTFKLIANSVGLECYYVSGNMPNDTIGHAWNKVKVDDEWYIVDTTESIDGNDSKYAPYILDNDDTYKGIQSIDHVYPDSTATEWVGICLEGCPRWYRSFRKWWLYD